MLMGNTLYTTQPTNTRSSRLSQHAYLSDFSVPSARTLFPILLRSSFTSGSFSKPS